MKTAEEVKTSIEKCFAYFMKLGKPFSYEIEGNGIRFYIGSEEMYKPMGELSIAQWYLCTLNLMFEKAAKQGEADFWTSGKKFCVFVKKKLDKKIR